MYSCPVFRYRLERSKHETQNSFPQESCTAVAHIQHQMQESRQRTATITCGKDSPFGRSAEEKTHRIKNNVECLVNQLWQAKYPRHPLTTKEYPHG